MEKPLHCVRIGVRPGEPSGPLTPKGRRLAGLSALRAKSGMVPGAPSVPAVTMDAEREFCRGFRILVRGRSCHGSW
jgi:hypothetical protein